MHGPDCPPHYADRREPTANRKTTTHAIDRIEALLDEGVRNKVYPGAVWAVGDAAEATGVLDPAAPGHDPHPLRPAARPPRSPLCADRARPGHRDQDVWVHYGFTGTGMWISPTKDRWAVLVTNKLYFTRDRQPLTDVRNTFRELTFG